MHARLAKEIRPLIYPWMLGMLAVLTLQFLLPLHAFDTSFGLLRWLVWPLCAAFLAARTFASEFQDRTLALWLSQPVTRAGIWRDKFLVLLPAVGVLTGFYLLSRIGGGFYHPDRAGGGFRFPPDNYFGIGLLSITASLVSAPYWASVARSTIGTLAFMLGAQFLAGVLILNGAAFLSANSGGSMVAENVFAWTCYLAYTAGFFRAGWNRFATLEAIEGAPAFSSSARTGGVASAAPTGWVLRPRPRGAWRNLVRKELQLQRPMLVLAAVFLATMVAVGLFDVASSSKSLRATVEVLRFLPLAFYAVMAVIVAGSAAFSEEKSLGTQAWSLTQPCGTRVQFLAKLGVSVSVFFLLGLLLPVGVMLLYSRLVPDMGEALAIIQRMDPQMLVTPPAILLAAFFICFWISSLTPNVVRAGLSTLATTVASGAVGAMFYGCARVYDSSPFDRSFWLRAIASDFPLFPSKNPFLHPFQSNVALLGSALVLLFLLRLSAAAFRNFRYSAGPSRSVFSQGLVLFVVLAAGASLFGVVQGTPDQIRREESRIWYQTDREVGNAVTALDKTKLDWIDGDVQTYAWRQLEETGRIGAATRARVGNEPRVVTVKRLSRLDPVLVSGGTRNQVFHFLTFTINPPIAIPENVYYPTVIQSGTIWVGP